MVISFVDETIAKCYIVVFFVMKWLFTSILAISYFQKTRYPKKKIQEVLFYWYVTEAPSGRPWMEIRHLVDPKKASAWRVKKGITLKILSESQANIAAKKLFQNVAKPGAEFIDLDDLARFLPENDALGMLSILKGTSDGIFTELEDSLFNPENDTRLSLNFIEGTSTQISCSSLQNWMVYAFRLEMSVILSIKDIDSIIRSMFIKVSLVSVIVLAVVLLPLVLGGWGYILYWFFHLLALLVLALVVKNINFFSTTFVGLDKKEYKFSSTTLWRKRIKRYPGRSGLENIHLILS